MTRQADSVRFATVGGLPGVELVSAIYAERAFPAHSHPEFVIGAVVGGAETLRVGGRSHVAPAGTVLLLDPGQTHSNASVGTEPLAYRVMYVPPSVVEAWAPHRLAFAAPVSRDARTFALTVAAHDCLSASSDRLEQQSVFVTLLDRLIAEAGGTTDHLAPRPDARIGEVAEYIDVAFASDLALDDLAPMAGLSRFHFVRRFKQVTGLTPVAYRNQRRVEAARLLLRDRLRPIAEIALEVGFADQSHLTRQFQRLMGVSPARYRQQ